MFIVKHFIFIFLLRDNSPLQFLTKGIVSHLTLWTSHIYVQTLHQSLLAYRVYISQLVRTGRICSNNLNTDTICLHTNLLNRDFGTWDCVWHSKDLPNLMQALLINMDVVWKNTLKREYVCQPWMVSWVEMSVHVHNLCVWCIWVISCFVSLLVWCASYYGKVTTAVWWLHYRVLVNWLAGISTLKGYVR